MRRILMAVIAAGAAAVVLATAWKNLPTLDEDLSPENNGWEY